MDTLATARVDVPWMYLFRHTALIFGIGLLALVAFFELNAPSLRGTCCWVYLDNNNCLAALTRGDPIAEAVAILVARFWKLAQRYDICVWFSRVRSALNPSELPTRGRKLPFRPRSSCPIASLRQLYRRCRAAIRKIAPRPRAVKKTRANQITFRRKK